MKVKKITKGYVNIPNGKIDITDPCYNKDVWCRINDVQIKPGDYRCNYYIGAELDQYDIQEVTELAKEFKRDVNEMIAMESEDIKHRCFVIELQLKGRAFQLDSPKWKKLDDIGVDAGLAGFFWNKPDFDEDSWTHFCDSMDFNKIAYLNKDMGFWCSSGYGDGCYPVYAIKENNKIIALKINF